MTLTLTIGLMAALYAGLIIVTVNGFEQLNAFIRKSHR